VETTTTAPWRRATPARIPGSTYMYDACGTLSPLNRETSQRSRWARDGRDGRERRASPRGARRATERSARARGGRRRAEDGGRAGGGGRALSLTIAC
jgi:hypothetical protein